MGPQSNILLIPNKALGIGIKLLKLLNKGLKFHAFLSEEPITGPIDEISSTVFFAL
jgi:hypothetical protein